MDLKKHFKKYSFYYLYFGMIALFLIVMTILRVLNPEAFNYDSGFDMFTGWRWQK